MKYLIVTLCVWLLTAAPLAARSKKPAPSPPPLVVLPSAPLAAETQGIYRDAAGHAHSWRISQAHTLEWEGAPFLPVGGFWSPVSWQPGAGPAAWDTDRQFLDTLKSRGVFDLCLTAGTVGLTHIASAAVQKTLDYLEANGFHYGLEIADFPQNPLVGYLVKPGSYRNPAPPVPGTAHFRHIPGLRDAFYMLVSHDGDVDDTGDAQIEAGDTASIALKNASPDDVLLLYPQRVFAPGTPESQLPDLWQGYDEYRDRLLTWFRGITLGPGFRFFLDPLTDKLAFNGEVENLVPTTDGYRMDFQAWLDRKYQHNVNDLNVGWGIADRDLPDFTVAARSLPLWYGARGVPAVYDPATRVRYEVLNKPLIGGHLWQDLRDFRTESVRGYMNAIADALKKGVADVPVVYQWTGHEALFSNPVSSGGYDGLCMTEGDAPTLERAAYTYGQAEESAKTTWLLAATGAANSRVTLLGTWSMLQSIGARGFLSTRLSAAPADPLDWLNAYAASLQVSAVALSHDKPQILWYPASLGLDLGVRQLSGGLWWLPSYQPGDRITLGGDLDGYALPDPGGRLPTYVVWSPRATLAQASFALGKDAVPLVTTPDGAPVKFTKKGEVFTIPVSADPVLISRVQALPLPLDAADAAEREAKRLLALADMQKISVQQIRDQYFYATNSISDQPGNADIRYDLLQRVIAGLKDALRPYVWLEGERATSYTFDSLVPEPKASGGAYLSLDTASDPPSGASSSENNYHATYSFPINASGRYTLWVAATPLTGRDASPFTWSVDDGPASDAQAAQSAGDLYADHFQWASLGSITLGRGPHTVTLTVTARRPSDNHYALSVDALCVTRVPFTPDGPRQPPIVALPPPEPPAPKR